MVDFAGTNIKMNKKRHNHEMLSQSIKAQNEQRSYDYATPASITISHLEMAKEICNHTRASQDDRKQWAAVRIYGNLLGKADDAILKYASQKVNESSGTLSEIALDAKHEVGHRNLVRAIGDGSPTLVGTYARYNRVNEEHIKLAIEKHNGEISAGKTSNNATQILKTLIKKAETSVLRSILTDSDLERSGFSVKTLLEDEITKRKKAHPLDQIMNGTYVYEGHGR